MALINVHEHLQSGRELPVLLRAMDETGIERAVILGSSAFTLTSDHRLGFTRYDENNLAIIGAARAHRDRIEAWPTLDPIDPRKREKLRFYHEVGASGVKLYLGHGFVAPGSAEYLFSSVAMDHPSMDAVYEYCGAHRLPICLHVNPGPETRGFADEFIAVLERHPQLLINAPHWILSTVRPTRLAELLDVFPNLVTDVSFGVDALLIAGLRRISRNSVAIRQVVIEHPDRFHFGTDLVVTRARHKTAAWIRVRVEAYLSMLSSKQYETRLLPSEVLNGLDLPETVLEQIGHRNYAEWRGPTHRSMVPVRAVDWTRMRVPRLGRAPGERLSVDSNVAEITRVQQAGACPAVGFADRTAASDKAARLRSR